MGELHTLFAQLQGFEDFVSELEEVTECQRKWMEVAKAETGTEMHR